MAWKFNPFTGKLDYYESAGASAGVSSFNTRTGAVTLLAADIPTGVDAAKIANGSISNTEFQYLNGVTSAIQTQLDNKQFKVFYTVGSTNADYITDGTADDVQIQQAIDAANAAGGGTVFIKEGTYSVASPIVLNSNVQLIGAGRGNTVLTTTTLTASNDKRHCYAY